MSNMDEKETDFDSDSEFRLVFTALDELKLLPWKSFFKKHLLQDVALSYMKDEEELKRVLNKELEPGLPFGIAFAFSRHWFKKYHAEALSVTSQKEADGRDESEGPLLEKGKKVELDGTINHSVTNQEIKTEDGNEGPLPLPEERQEPSQTSQKEKDDSAFMIERSVVRDEPSLGNPSTNGRDSTWPKDSKTENLVRPLREEVEQLNDQPIQKRELSKEYNGRDQNHDGGKSDLITKKDLPEMTCFGITNPPQIDEDSPEKGKGEDEIYEENKIVTDDKYDPTSSSASPIDAVALTKSSTSAVEQPLGGQEERYRTEAFLDHFKESNLSPSAGQISSTLEKDKGDVLEEQEISALSAEDFEDLPEEVSRCTPRPFGKKGRETCYQKGIVLDIEENREVEFKSLVSAPSNSLPWKIMEKAKKFICACLNADTKGIIYFGVGDCQEQGSKYKRGEVLGLDVECTIDDIVKAFQFVLDGHLKSDAGPLQKGGEQNCVRLEFVPVTSQGQRTSLYVIEIEVVREWMFCKDHIYYSKSWTEKRGTKNGKDPSTKKALHEFFKVHKDEFDDVAIRTNGASNNVKKHEVMKQVKEPLMTKYKEWKKEAKFAMDAAISDLAADDADTQNFSKVIRERLHGLNFKDFGYILVANKLPPQYRGTPYLSFLQNIPWVAVFDLFDASSKKDGLHYACNETTDAPRAKIRTLDDFKEVSSDLFSDKEFSLSIRGTTWIFNNEDMHKRDWIKDSKDCLYRALSAYKRRFLPGRLLCVFLGLGENAVHEMSDIIECCFSIFGNTARSCVTVISENKLVAEGFVKASKSSLQKDLKDCSVSGIPWALLKEIVREMVGPAKFEERNATVELPFFTGKLKEVLNKVIQSWDDLEVYSPSPRLPKYSEEIEKARDAFYKGAHANQINLFHNHSIERTLEDDINFKVDHALKSLSKPSTELSCHVKTVTVPYEPGSGATTLCRRILWKKRKDYRCAVIKAFTTATDFQIEELQGICYDEKNLKYSTPALVLVDNFPEIDIRRLTERIMKRQTKCVILSTFPIAKSETNVFDVKPLRQLDECETSRVKNILINITSDAERRREAEQILDREKRFIWFGLELFGREYEKIEERLRSHIKSTLAFIGDSKDVHEMILQFCCFLHYYSDGRAILPHPVVSDFLYEASDKTDEQCAYMQHVHDIFGGLLLEGFNETNGYYGWRPAHSLVSEVVTSTLKVNETALLLLEKVDKGTAYVNKFLRQQLFKVFLDRKRISDPVFLDNLGTDDDSIESDLELEVLGFYEKRTRYSPLIVDIVNGESGIEGALELLIAICEKAIEDKAYAWQQLARFMGYEMRTKSMDNEDRLHKRLYNTMKAAKDDLKRPMPETGTEAAHIAVDIAISHQPNYSHHYVTKGVLYHLQLRDFTPDEHTKLPCLMPEVIDICRKALDVYDKALSTTDTLNLYSMIGKIQAIVSLLTIVKGLPCFGREGESFTRYLKKGEIPRDMDALTEEEHGYVQSLPLNTLDLLNQLFRDVKFRQMTTYNESEVRSLSNAKIRASKLRREFYKITGFDKSELMSDAEFSLASSPIMKEPAAVYQQHVQDILFKHDETPYSAWVSLSDGDVSSIYNLLKRLCRRGHGSHDDMLICCKACLRLRDRPSVEELGEIVGKWVERFPNSEWAHLFNYMLHFPIPNRSLGTDGHCAKSSIKTCDRIVREKTHWGYRKLSGAEYFLGKGIGLYAIVTSQEFRATSQESRWLETTKETKTEFWRSKEVSDKLERVCGQKDVNFKGVITYEGIQLRFDNTRYPNESKDDLWFYIGFSLAGPYAYDPVDNDHYDIMKRKTEEATPFTPSAPAVSKPSDTFGTFSGGIGRGKIRDKVVKGPDPKMQFEGLNHDFPDLFQSTQSQRAKGLRSPTPHSLSTSFSLSDVSRVSGGATSLTRLHFSFCNLSQSTSVDDLYQSDTTFRPSYASALQHRTPAEVEGAKTAPRQPTGETLSKSKWKYVKGVCGKKTRFFKPRFVDEQGRLHHGAKVLGAQKSLECNKHTGPIWSTEETTRCTFAHAWRGDTVQTVCSKCTDRNKSLCLDRHDHKERLWNLGPYITEEGKIWESPGGSI